MVVKILPDTKTRAKLKQINMGDLSFNAITFPLWWYSQGITLLFMWLKNTLIKTYGISHMGLIAQETFTHHLSHYGFLRRLLLISLGLILLTFQSLLFALACVCALSLLILYVAILPVTLSLFIYQLFVLL